MEDNPKQVLNAYIYDFLVKSFFKGSAAAFYQEADLQEHGRAHAHGPSCAQDEAEARSERESEGALQVWHDTPQSYLYEWWQIFWDLCAARGRGGGSRNAQIYNEAWTKRQEKMSRHRSQELKAASLQQMAEDAGEYEGEEVDPVLLAMVVAKVPYGGGLHRRVPAEGPAPQEDARPFKRTRQRNDTFFDQTSAGNTNPDYLLFTSPSQDIIDFSMPGGELESTESSERSFNFLDGI